MGLLQTLENRRANVIEGRWTEQRGILWDMHAQDRLSAEKYPLSAKKLDKVSSAMETAYACLDVIASKVAEVEWELVQNGAPVRGHFLSELFQRPSPRHSPYDFRYALTHNLMSAGEAPVELVMEPVNRVDLVSEMWPVIPSYLHEVDAVPGGGLVFLFEVNRQKIVADSSQVLFLKTHNPASELRGMPPLTSARKTLDIHGQMSEYQYYFFLNSAMPGVIISMEQNITDKVADEYASRWNSKFQGAKKNSRAVVLGKSAKVSTAGFAQKDLEFLEGLRRGDKMVQRVFRVPDCMLAETEGSSQHQAEQGRASFYMDVIIPIVKFLKWQINNNVVKRFDPGTEGLELVFKTDWIDAMLPHMKDKNEVAQGLAKSFWSANEIRAQLWGKEAFDHPWANEPLVQSNLIPLSLLGENRSVLNQSSAQEEAA